MTNKLDQFIGQKVSVVETTVVYDRGNGKKMEFIQADVSDDDTTISELKKLAGNNVRVWFPGSFGTTDMDQSRLNVNVEKQEDNSYQITQIYFG